MRVKPIRSEREHRRALKEIVGLMDARCGTPEGDQLDVLTALVEVWEERHYAIEPPHPVDSTAK